MTACHNRIMYDIMVALIVVAVLAVCVLVGPLLMALIGGFLRY